MIVPLAYLPTLALLAVTPRSFAVEATDPSLTEVAAFVRARAVAAWGEEILAPDPRTAPLAVTIAPGEEGQLAVEVRDGLDLVAQRSVAAAPSELAMIEAWIVVRAAIERAGTDDATPAIPRAGASDPPPAATSSVGAAPEPASTAGGDAAEASAVLASGTHDGAAEPEVVVSGAPLAAPAAARPAPASDASVSGLVDALRTGPLVETWGLVLSSQLAGAVRGGVTATARRHLFERVTLGARVGVEWSNPLSGVSATRLPMAGTVGWEPVAGLPVEIGTFAELSPVWVSADADSSAGGLGLGFGLGGYTRGALALGPVSVVGELGLALPLVRHSYSSSAETATDPALELRLGVGVEWRWP